MLLEEYKDRIAHEPERLYVLAMFDQTRKLIAQETSTFCENVLLRNLLEGNSGDVFDSVTNYPMEGYDFGVGNIASGTIEKIVSRKVFRTDPHREVVRIEFLDDEDFAYILDIHQKPKESPAVEDQPDNYDITLEDVETFAEAMVIADERGKGLYFLALFIDECLNGRFASVTETSFDVLSELSVLGSSTTIEREPKRKKI